jgi:hypothetical protein
MFGAYCDVLSSELFAMIKALIITSVCVLASCDGFSIIFTSKTVTDFSASQSQEGYKA